MKYIGIDTEYLAKGTSIKKVFCVAATHEDGRTFARWIGDGIFYPNILDEILIYFGETKENIIFICHAYELAERRAFALLGAVPGDYNWLDTWHIAKLLGQAFTYTQVDLSLLHLCKRLLNIDLDADVAAITPEILQVLKKACKKPPTTKKAAMRELCIQDLTEGFEEDILNYCLNDTKYLCDLCVKLIKEYAAQISKSVCIGASPFAGCKDAQDKILKAHELLLDHMRFIEATARMAEYGFPINGDRLAAVKIAAEWQIEQHKKELSERYPGLFYKDKLGEWHQSQEATQKYLYELIESRHITSYPTTATGAFSTSSDVLKEYFDRQDNFGSDLAWFQLVSIQLRGVAGNWARNFDRYISRMPYVTGNPFGSATGRCQPSSAKGFVLSWAHYLYGILEPPEGKLLVELDFTAEETAIMAALTQDANYKEVYESKDTYMWFCDKLKLIPHDDYINLSKAELKAKYKAIRHKIKVFTLAWGYGAGADKLARIAGVESETARTWKSALDNEIFKTATTWKNKIYNALSGMTGSSVYDGVCLPDGLICRSRDLAHKCARYTVPAEIHKGKTSIINWPFQAFGSLILRRVVARLKEFQCVPVATFHDAILFEVDDTDAGRAEIAAIRSMMASEATDALFKRVCVKVGEPEIIERDKPWAPEGEELQEFMRIYERGAEILRRTEADDNALIPF